MNRVILILAIYLALMVSAHSQVTLDRSVVAMTGGYFENEGMKLSFTVGEYFTETISSKDLILTQGFQQPDGKVLKTVKLPDNTLVTLSVFPNPVIDNLNIQYFGDEETDVKIQIYDIFGKSVAVKDIRTIARQQIQYSVDLQSLKPGFYVVRVTNRQKELNAVFKITKII